MKIANTLCVWCGHEKNAHTKLEGPDTLVSGFEKALSDCPGYEAGANSDEEFASNLASKLHEEDLDLQSLRLGSSLDTHWDG